MVRNYAIIYLMFTSIVPMECVLLKEMCEIMMHFWKSDFCISELVCSVVISMLYCKSYKAR